MPQRTSRFSRTRAAYTLLAVVVIVPTLTLGATSLTCDGLFGRPRLTRSQKAAADAADLLSQIAAESRSMSVSAKSIWYPSRQVTELLEQIKRDPRPIDSQERVLITAKDLKSFIMILEMSELSGSPLINQIRLLEGMITRMQASNAEFELQPSDIANAAFRLMLLERQWKDIYAAWDRLGSDPGALEPVRVLLERMATMDEILKRLART